MPKGWYSLRLGFGMGSSAQCHLQKRHFSTWECYTVTHLLPSPREQEEQDSITDLLLPIHAESSSTLHALLWCPPCFLPSCTKGGLHTLGGLGRPPQTNWVSQNLQPEHLGRETTTGNSLYLPSRSLCIQELKKNTWNKLSQIYLLFVCVYFLSVCFYKIGALYLFNLLLHTCTSIGKVRTEGESRQKALL